MDDHIWCPSRIGDKDRAVTAMVDLTRGGGGVLPVRLDVVPGRSGTRYAGLRVRSRSSMRRECGQRPGEHPSGAGTRVLIAGQQLRRDRDPGLGPGDQVS